MSQDEIENWLLGDSEGGDLHIDDWESTAQVALHPSSSADEESQLDGSPDAIMVAQSTEMDDANRTLGSTAQAYRQRHEWQLDFGVCSRVAGMIVGQDFQDTRVLSNCPDYGTARDYFVSNGPDEARAERSLFVVVKPNAARARGIQQRVVDVAKHSNQPFISKFPGPNKLPRSGPYPVLGQSVHLMRRVCNWTGLPEDFEVEFHIWRFDIDGAADNDLWVGLVVPCPPNALGKRKGDPSTSSRSRKRTVPPRDQIVRGILSLIRKENEPLKDEDALLQGLENDLDALINRYCDPEVMKRYRGLGNERNIRIRGFCIGNDDYSNVHGRLENCGRDAKLFHSKLSAVPDAYAVVTVNSTKAHILQKLDEFLADCAEKKSSRSIIEIIFWSYAGHAVQLNGEIYLLPVDIPDTFDEGSLKESAISFNSIYQKVNDAVQDLKTSVVFVLDACRNAPPGMKWGLPEDSLSASKLLEGTSKCSIHALVLLSTSAGCRAEDGTGCNSPFAAILSEAFFSSDCISIVAASNNACLKHYEHTGQRPALVGYISPELSFTRSNGILWCLDTENLVAMPETISKEAAMLLVEDALAAPMRVATNLARLRHKVALNDASDDPEVQTRIEVYRAQRLLLEVTPTILSWLLESCWKAKLPDISWTEESVREYFKSVIACLGDI